MSDINNHENKKIMEELIVKLIHNEPLKTIELALLTSYSLEEMAQVAMQIEKQELLANLPAIAILSQLSIPFGGINENLSNSSNMSNFQKNLFIIEQISLIKKLIHNEPLTNEELVILANYSFEEMAQIAMQTEKQELPANLPAIAILSQLSIPFGGINENLSHPSEISNFQANVLAIQQYQAMNQQKNQKGNSR